MAIQPVWVLVHSPLVGPATWSQVQPGLESHGFEVVVPELREENPNQPYWKRHCSSVARQLDDEGVDDPVLLVGHSGAGPLLPSLAEECGREIAAYVFVDAGIPRDGESRLEAMRREAPELAEQLYEHLRSRGRFPEWTVEMLTDIPSMELRRRVISELHPRGLDFFDEPIRVFSQWPDAPAAYLRFTAGYETSAAWAEEQGWPVERIEGGHFQTLADPVGTAESLVRLMFATVRQ